MKKIIKKVYNHLNRNSWSKLSQEQNKKEKKLLRHILVRQGMRSRCQRSHSRIQQIEKTRNQTELGPVQKLCTHSYFGSSFLFADDVTTLYKEINITTSQVIIQNCINDMQI